MIVVSLKALLSNYFVNISAPTSMFLTPRKKYKYYRYIYNTEYKTNQNKNLEHLLLVY